MHYVQARQLTTINIKTSSYRDIYIFCFCVYY